MKKNGHILNVIAAVLLASCSSGLPVFNSAPNDVPRGFSAHLANEYQNLSIFLQTYKSDKKDADHFMAKARRALRQQEVFPDRPEGRDLPEFAVRQLEDARIMLDDALATMNSAQNEPLLAMAQTRYDCWLAAQEELAAPDAYISCKEDFYNALALLDMPVTDETVHSIYFDTASIALNDAGKEVIRKVAERYRDREEWGIILKGFTDKTGDRQQNKVLSMRRAIAVKHALAQYGIQLENIAISAEGEAREAEGAEGRRVDIQARPHYAARNKKGLRLAPGWHHSAEF